MRLIEIFKEQKDFQKYFYDPDNISDEDKIKFTKEYILSMHKELSEILDTLSWKLHRKEDKAKSTHNTLEEIIVQSTGGAGKITKGFLKKTGFTSTEHFNRLIAANAGRNYTLENVDKLLSSPVNKFSNGIIRTLQ